MTQGELFISAIKDGMSDVDSVGKPKEKAHVFRNYTWQEIQGTIEQAIAEGRHSAEHKFLCVACREYVDALFHLDVFSCPKRLICRACAAKIGVQGAADRNRDIGKDVALPVESVAESLPAGVKRAEEIGLPESIE